MSAPTAKSKRGPTVLMTDSRDSAPRQQQRPSSSLQRQATGARLISVDNILQYASDIPSQQRRGPPATRPVHHSRTPSGRHPLDPKLSGRLIPALMPTRSSKLSEKLVLLPETNEEDEDEKGEFDGGEDAGPPTDAQLGRQGVQRRLLRTDPLPAHLDHLAVAEVGIEGAAADPVARLQDRHPDAQGREAARRRDAGGARPDDDDLRIVGQGGQARRDARAPAFVLGAGRPHG